MTKREAAYELLCDQCRKKEAAYALKLCKATNGQGVVDFTFLCNECAAQAVHSWCNLGLQDAIERAQTSSEKENKTGDKEKSETSRVAQLVQRFRKERLEASHPASRRKHPVI